MERNSSNLFFFLFQVRSRLDKGGGMVKGLVVAFREPN